MDPKQFRITKEWVVKLGGLTFAIEVLPGLKGAESINYGKDNADRKPKTALLVDQMIDGRNFRSKYLETHNYCSFTQKYNKVHGEYDLHKEIRYVAGLFRSFIVTYPFLTRCPTVGRNTSLRAMDGKFANSDYIMRYKNMYFNMSTDDTNGGGSGAFQLTPALATKHVFFYDAKQVLSFMSDLHNYPNLAFLEALNEDKYRHMMLGDTVMAWSSFFPETMRKFLTHEGFLVEKKKMMGQQKKSRSSVSSESSHVTHMSYAETKACSYNETSLFDLLKLFRHLSQHLTEANERYKGIGDHVGWNVQKFVNYFALNVPAMYTVFWVLGVRSGIICTGEGIEEIQFSACFDEKQPEWDHQP